MSHPYQRLGRPRHPDVLTPAEWRVLAGVREGLSNAEVAESLGCGVETVRFHLRHVREKLGLRSRQALRDWPGRPVGQPALSTRATSNWSIREQIPLIAVSDMRRSLAFYMDTLQMVLVARFPDEPEEPGWVALASGAARLMLHAGHHRRDERSLRPGGTVTLSLYTDGLDAIHSALEKAGCRPGSIERMPYGAREFYVLDPDGNELALVEFAGSDPSYTIERTTEEQ